METAEKKQTNYKLHFWGEGSQFFSIIIVNWLLTIVTLGIYYPWARAKKLKYLFGSTALNDDRFSFHGTGKEMFIGMVKLIVVLFATSGIIIAFYLIHLPGLGIILFYLLLLLVVPLAIHGSFRYRMSRTSLRGIRFGYRGNRRELVVNFLKWFFLTLITVGIYGAWLAIHMRKYTLSNVRYGDVQCRYQGDGGEFFILNLKGYFLTLITLGIYSFWWQKDLFNYYVDNTRFVKDDQSLYLHSTATGGGFFRLLVVNLLLIVFTLGLGYAWAEMRTMRYITENIVFSGDLDLDTVQQTEDEYKNAFGEDMLDFFDIDLF